VSAVNYASTLTLIISLMCALTRCDSMIHASREKSKHQVHTVRYHDGTWYKTIMWRAP